MFAVTGNAITIFLFAFGAGKLRSWMRRRRSAKGKSEEPPRIIKAQRSFDRWGIYGLAILGPLFIGTQFGALVAVAGGVKPLRASIAITAATVSYTHLRAHET